MSQVKVIRKDSIRDELDQMQQSIEMRAYELFEQRGSVPGDAWADWFAAEREIVREPAIDLREERGAYTVSAMVDGIEPENVCVEVAPQDVVITAEVEWRHVPNDGQMQASQFRTGRMFRSVHLPRAIDLAKVHADYRNGLLIIKAPIAPAARVELSPA
jgi:HSP20 family protein